jgi:D-alanyl-D-alanine carboxypeptidase/D-alanyl-D-alanine-endopeptidase (penicillin-binding protein 4)
MKGRLAAAVLACALLLACYGTPAPAFALQSSAQLQNDTATSRLQRRIAGLLADPAIGAGIWGIEARSLSNQEVLAAVNAHTLLTPASTMKTITLAVAADRLGWDYTYETQVFATGPIANGTLDGDLIAVGSGDPSLDDWDGQASIVFRSWADHLRDLGVTTVSGRIIGDDDAFGDDGLGPGWAWDDMAFSYSAPASALQFNQGTAQIVVTAGASVGAPAVVTVSPPFADVPLDAQVVTTAAGAPPSLVLTQHPRSPVVTLTGGIGVGSRQLRNVAVENPTLYFTRALRAGLVANGIDVRGDAVDIDDIEPAPRVSGSPVLTHRSPALSSIADTLMKLSQNLYAETLLRTLAPAEPHGATAEAGRDVEREVLAGWGLDPADMLIADGSGLSRYNLLTPDAMVAVLAHVYGDDRLRYPYLAALPLGGRSGTLAQRLRGTRAEGNVSAKTGSFTHARAVAGFVRTADGEPVAFAIVANNYGVAAAEVDRVTDAILVSLAEIRRE